jgi:hypothetical protein
MGISLERPKFRVEFSLDLVRVALSVALLLSFAASGNALEFA